MKKWFFPRLLLLSVLALSVTIRVYSQNIPISGVVVDEKNTPLSGATISIKGTNIAATTNSSGEFSLSAPKDKKVLVVSSIGYETKELTFENGTNLSVSLKSSVIALENIVVTALGFEVQKDKLGYSTSKIGGQQIANSGEATLIDALAGKAAGVRISRTSGDPGAAAQILLRGQSTITRGTEPLIIIDGIPINGDARNESNGNTTQQSRLNDISQEDIANIQILKGASAAALWGTRAANGVVMITTKKGSGGKANISFKSTYSIDEVSEFYDLQSTYGQGLNGAWQANAIRSWGDKISSRAGGADVFNTTGASFVGQSGRVYYPITTKNAQDIFLKQNYDGVLGNGHYFENSISISGGDSKSNYYISLNDLNQTGIIQNGSSYRRSGFRINAGKDLNKWLSISNKSSYTLINSDRIQTGVNNAGLMIGLLRTPPDFENADYIGSYAAAPGGALAINRQRSYRNYTGSSTNPGFNNPGWIINKLQNTSKVNRFINSAEIKIKPVQWASLTTRAGIDFFTDQQINYFPFFSANAITGQYNRNEFTQMQFNVDVIAQAERNLTEKLSGNLLIGYNYNVLDNSTLGGQSQNFILPNGPQDFDNATPTNINTTDVFLKRITNAGYTSLGLAYNDQLYLNLTGRLEAASTFGELAKKSFFYPSADIAWQFSKLKLFDASKILSFGKLRVAYGVVGVQPLSYRTLTTYSARSFQDGLGGLLDPALYGTGSILESSARGNAFLRPEKKQEFEIGTDLRLLNNKLSFGFTYYRNETQDALISIPQASSTGFESLYANAGNIRNRGAEIELGYSLVNTNDWNVGLNFNWSRNVNKVTNLNGATSINLGGTAGVSSRAVEGYALGVLYSTKWVRDAKNDLVLDANGFPTPDIVSSPIGDPNPEWRGGFGFNVKYKNITLSALVEHSQGGLVVNGTEGVLLDYGTSAATGFERVHTGDLKRYNGTTITAGTPFRGNIQDFGAGPVALDQSWYTGPGGWFGNVGEQYLEDATWTRFRELSLSYAFNPGKLKKVFGLTSAVIEISGRNLFLISDVKGYDPDSNVAGSGSARGVVYFVNPPTRSYLFSLKLNF